MKNYALLFLLINTQFEVAFINMSQSHLLNSCSQSHTISHLLTKFNCHSTPSLMNHIIYNKHPSKDHNRKSRAWKSIFQLNHPNTITTNAVRIKVHAFGCCPQAVYTAGTNAQHTCLFIR